MYSNSLVCNILKYINENKNLKITIEDLERKFFYSRFYIMKLFKKELNITIIDYINSIRIYNAVLCIKNSNTSILYIAYNNGFYSIEYFSEMFKKIIGVKPLIAKNYFRKNKINDINSIDQINNSIIRLYQLKINIEKYLKKEKPKHTMVKKLTIFKK